MALPFNDACALRETLNAAFNGLGGTDVSSAMTLSSTVHIYLDVLDSLAAAQLSNIAFKSSSIIGLRDYLDLTTVIGAFVRSRLEECAHLGTHTQLTEAREKIQSIRRSVDAQLANFFGIPLQTASFSYPSPVTPNFESNPSTHASFSNDLTDTSTPHRLAKRKRSPSVDFSRKAPGRAAPITVHTAPGIQPETSIILPTESIQVFSLGLHDTAALHSKLQLLHSLIHIDLRVLPGQQLEEIHIDAFFCTPAPKLQTMKYDHVYPRHFPEVWTAPSLIELDCRVSQISTPSPPASLLEQTLGRVRTFHALVPRDDDGQATHRQSLAHLPHVLRNLTRLALFSPVRDVKDYHRFEYLDRLTVDQTDATLWNDQNTVQTLTRLAAATVPGVYIRNGTATAIQHMLRAPAIVVGFACVLSGATTGRVVQVEHDGERSRCFTGMDHDTFAFAFTPQFLSNLTFLALGEMMPPADLQLLFAAAPPTRLARLEIRIVQLEVPRTLVFEGQTVVSIFEFEAVANNWGMCQSLLSLGIGTGDEFGQFVALPVPVLRSAELVRNFIRNVLGSPLGMVVALRGVQLVE